MRLIGDVGYCKRVTWVSNEEVDSRTTASKRSFSHSPARKQIPENRCFSQSPKRSGTYRDLCRVLHTEFQTAATVLWIQETTYLQNLFDNQTPCLVLLIGREFISPKNSMQIVHTIFPFRQKAASSENSTRQLQIACKEEENAIGK